MPTVEIPSALRVRTAGLSTVAVKGATVAQVLEELCEAHPQLRPQLFTPAGKLKRTIGIFVGEDDVRGDEDRALPAHARLVLVAALAGG